MQSLWSDACPVLDIVQMSDIVSTHMFIPKGAKWCRHEAVLAMSWHMVVAYHMRAYPHDP